jgi:hypothetical protein
MDFAWVFERASSLRCAGTMKLSMLVSVLTTLCAVDCSSSVGSSAQALSNHDTPVFGIHEGSINSCDNGERWVHQGALTSVATSKYDGSYEAMAPGGPDDQHESPWWRALGVKTVRVSVPWDIALAGTSAASLINPSGTQKEWATLHTEALTNEQSCLDMWLNAAHVVGATPEIAFKPDYDYRDPSSNRILVPDIKVYTQAMQAFVDRYSRCGTDSCSLSNTSFPGGHATIAQVHIIAPWGEPDFNGKALVGNYLGAEGDPTIDQAVYTFYMPNGTSRFGEPSCSSSDESCGPVLAAEMWVAVDDVCGDACVLHSGPTAYQRNSGVIAGDFSSAGGSVGNPSYLSTYAQNLSGKHPVTWAMHAYTDTSTYEWCRLQHQSYDPSAGGDGSESEKYLNSLHDLGYHNDTYVWFDEISVFVQDTMFLHSGGPCGHNSSSTPPMYTPAIQSDAFDWLMTKLTAVHGDHPGDEPRVNRIYYMRAFSNGGGGSTNIVPNDPSYPTVDNGAPSTLYDAMVHYSASH